MGTHFLGSDLTSSYIRSYQFGKATSFDKDRDSGWIGGRCFKYSNSYEIGFKAGCELENIDDSCELTIEGEERYCINNPDNPACTEFLLDASNK